jgi:hypothetical protein
LRGDHIDSNVRYSAPLLGSGWLSAAGGFREKDTETVEVLFDSFWWDTGFDGLTPDPAGKVRRPLLAALLCSAAMKA